MNSKQYQMGQQLPPDRFLSACPIRYECRSLFVFLIEMEYIEETQSVETILQYPEYRDQNYFKTDQHLADFLSNVKKFAFPYKKTTQNNINNNNTMSRNNQNNNSNLVQFFPFVFTDENRIRQYGYCRSAKGGNHILCLISYLPWYSVFIGLLNKISTVINEKETDSLYHFLEAVYEFDLPEPGSFAEILSHDGMDEIKFWCPDRRIVPSINENRNLLKFFAFFDLEKIIKIFTALLLERHIMIVSRDLENMTACALSLEYLIYPLEWFHAFTPIMPEHIDSLIFNQPFPYIYGVHTSIYEKLSQNQKDDAFILLVDERQIINGDKDKLPDNVVEYLHRKLKYFHDENESIHNSNPDYSYQTSASSSRVNVDKYDRLLHSGTIEAFLNSVLMIIDDYREYLKYDLATNQFKFDEETFFHMKNVDTSNKSLSNRYSNESNEFYHEFRITQAFEEFCRDRSDYLKREIEHKLNNNSQEFEKDFIETLCDKFRSDNNTFQQIIMSGKKNIQKAINKAKEKSLFKKLLNNTANVSMSRPLAIKPPVSSNDTSETSIPVKLIESIAKTLNDEDSFSSSSSNSSASSASPSDSTASNDEKIKETIRRYDCASQASMNRINDLDDTSFNRKSLNNSDTYDLSNDPDIKKYFQQTQPVQTKSIIEPKTQPQPQPQIQLQIQPLVTATKQAEEEKLIDFSDFNETNTNNNNNSYNNNTNTSIINNSMSDPLISNRQKVNNNFTFTSSLSASSALLKPERKQETIESIIDEFDPIKNSSLANSMSQHQRSPLDLSNFVAKPYVQRPNYNIALPYVPTTPTTMNFPNNSVSPFNQINQINQQSNPLVAETIARFNSINQHHQWVSTTPRQQSAQSFTNPTNLIKK